MQKGKMACLIITLALMGTVFSTVILGMDMHETEVTKFKQIADISGSFDYDDTPQYIDYDTATNKTGYYTDDTYPYFGGVDYVETNVPTYPINQRPIVIDINSADLSRMDLRQLSPPVFKSGSVLEEPPRYFYIATSDPTATINWEYRYPSTPIVEYTGGSASIAGGIEPNYDGAKVTSVQDFIEGLDLAMNYDEVIINLGNENNRVLIAENKWEVVKKEWSSSPSVYTKHTDYLSILRFNADTQPVKAVYNYSTEMVYFYDVEGRKVGSTLASEAAMIYDGNGRDGTKVLSTIVGYEVVQYPPAIYLDADYGVSIREN